MQELSVKMSESITTYYHPGKMVWNYDQGFAIMGVLNTGIQYKQKHLIQWACDMYDHIINEDGTIDGFRTGEYNLDKIQSGRILFDLYGITGNDKYRKAITMLDEQLQTQPRTNVGVFWHKEIYPWQIWLDGLYMQGPFWTRCGHTLDVMTQLIKTYSILKDPKTGLLWHAFDESRGMRWSDPVTGLSHHFWSRSIGWYLMACVDVLDFALKEDPLSEDIKNIVRELLPAIFNYQDESGMWYQITDQGTREGNYLETSGTAMFCYSALKACRMGIVSGYEEKSVKGIDGITRIYVTEENGVLHLDGICGGAGLGGNPCRDGSFNYYISEKQRRDDYKGLGSYLIALLEKEAL